MRLDLFLLEKGFETSRERAKTLINAGSVTVDSKIITKPSFDVDDEAHVEISEPLKYVSRGGLKLEFALHAFNIDAANSVCLDIGASTGGFTDCLLKHGAKLVYAVDVGTNQLAPALKNNTRVVSYEKQNILSDFADFADIAGDFPHEAADLIVCDVSFISVTKILPRIKTLMGMSMSTNEKCSALVLIKPQFEIPGRHKNGIIKSAKERAQAVDNVKNTATALGLNVCGIKECPVSGKDGNVEYFMLLAPGGLL
jgi:23S rRNA (cytidine1920-2'-O)/16S rRNA (cytidine1409-2'-O)-methyltransferase